jgi:hypothetical protein
MGVNHRLGQRERKWIFGGSSAKAIVTACWPRFTICVLSHAPFSSFAHAQVWPNGFVVELALVDSSGVCSGAESAQTEEFARYFLCAGHPGPLLACKLVNQLRTELR